MLKHVIFMGMFCYNALDLVERLVIDVERYFQLRLLRVLTDSPPKSPMQVRKIYPPIHPPICCPPTHPPTNRVSASFASFSPTLNRLFAGQPPTHPPTHPPTQLLTRFEKREQNREAEKVALIDIAGKSNKKACHAPIPYWVELTPPDTFYVSSPQYAPTAMRPSSTAASTAGM